MGRIVQAWGFSFKQRSEPDSAELAALMQASVKKEMEAEDPELLQLVEMEFVVPNGNFSVTTDGMSWIFQPYEVGPYALGIVTAHVSWEELKPYLQ